MSTDQVVTLEVRREDAWRLYDLVTGRAELIAAQEYQAMQGLGGSPWYALAKTLRTALEARPVAADARPGSAEGRQAE